MRSMTIRQQTQLAHIICYLLNLLGSTGWGHECVLLSRTCCQVSGNAHPRLCAWELKDFDSDNNGSGAGGKWHLKHELYLNQMVSEISPWLTEYVDNRNWPVPPVISVLAFHPNDGDIMYLLIQSKVVCNLQSRTLEVFCDIPHSGNSHIYIYPQYLNLCATILDNYYSFFSLTETECHLPPTQIVINILLLVGFCIMVSICLSIMLDNVVIAIFSNSCYFLVMFIYQNHPLMYLLILFIFTPVT